MTAAVHREGLHWLLWDRQGDADRLRIDQRGLADELGVNRFTVNRVLARMEQEGRLRKIPGAGASSRLFVILDPAEWVAPDRP